jgi:hypothetical protein
MSTPHHLFRSLALASLLLATAGAARAEQAQSHQDAELRWAAQNAAQAAARKSQWYVVAWAGAREPCIPVPDVVATAHTPDEALAVIQQTDPDAYLVPAKPGDLDRIIRTQGHSLRMVQTPLHCRVWNNLIYGGPRGVRPNGVPW